MKKSKIPILVNHDPSRIIGHINPFIKNTTLEKYNPEVKISTSPKYMKKLLSWGYFDDK